MLLYIVFSKLKLLLQLHIHSIQYSKLNIWSVYLLFHFYFIFLHCTLLYLEFAFYKLCSPSFSCAKKIKALLLQDRKRKHQKLCEWQRFVLQMFFIDINIYIEQNYSQKILMSFWHFCEWFSFGDFDVPSHVKLCENVLKICETGCILLWTFKK